MKIIRPMTIDDAALNSSNVTEADYAAYDVGTSYALGDRVIYIAADTHLIFESLQAANLGNDPLAVDSAWWLEVGATNRWKMFDLFSSSQTSNADSIEVEIQADGRVDTVGLINLSAATAQLVVTDAVDGEIYNQTINLTSGSGITNWYAYFFEPISRVGSAFFNDIPPYNDSVFTLTLSDAGETVLLGTMVMGLAKNIGGTNYGAQLGIQDFSRKEVDDFGNFTIIERAYSQRATFPITVEAGFVDELLVFLASIRATPMVYIGSDEYAGSMIYGFYRDFTVEIAYREKSICTLEIEGLT